MRTLTSVLSAAVLALGLTAILPGCQTETIAPGASLVASGTGNTTYTVADDGTITIYDKTWNKRVYVGEVRAGQVVTLDANADKVLVDGQVRVEQIPLGEGSEYQFFLRPNRIVEHRTIIHDSPVIERRTVIERDVP